MGDGGSLNDGIESFDILPCIVHAGVLGRMFVNGTLIRASRV